MTSISSERVDESGSRSAYAWSDLSSISCEQNKHEGHTAYLCVKVQAHLHQQFPIRELFKQASAKKRAGSDGYPHGSP